MGNFPHSVATIVLMTIPVAGPRLATGISPGKFQNDQLIGAGLFRHRVRDDGSLAFELSTRAVGIWADDDELVSWLEAGLDDVDVLANGNTGRAQTNVGHQRFVTALTGEGGVFAGSTAPRAPSARAGLKTSPTPARVA